MPKAKKFMAALVAFAISIPITGLVAPPDAAAPVAFVLALLALLTLQQRRRRGARAR